jgi:outer membrane protein assembly factor BamB
VRNTADDQATISLGRSHAAVGTCTGRRALSKLWQVDLEAGYSGPVVWGDKVFTAETENQETEVVRALDRQTGKELWRASWSGAMKVPFFARSNGSWIRATPACDGERLYVAGMRDVLVCLDIETGNEVWRYDFVKELETPLPAFGVLAPLGRRLGHRAGRVRNLPPQ